MFRIVSIFEEQARIIMLMMTRIYQLLAFFSTYKVEHQLKKALMHEKKAKNVEIAIHASEFAMDSSSPKTRHDHHRFLDKNAHSSKKIKKTK